MIATPALTDAEWLGLARIPARDGRFADVADFYATESELLDGGRLKEWLRELVANEVEYRAPVRVTRRRGDGDGDGDGAGEFLGTMTHLDENRASLTARLSRGDTGVAWAEDPPSRARRHVSGLRVYESPDESTTVWAGMNVLLTRNRFDRPDYELISYERRDGLEAVDGGYRLRRRVILIDQSCLGTVNLAILL